MRPTIVVQRSLSGGEFVSALAKAARITAYDAAVPGSDAALLALSQFRERLPASLLLGLPAHDIVARSLNKLALLEEADRVRLSVLGVAPRAGPFTRRARPEAGDAEESFVSAQAPRTPCR